MIASENTPASPVIRRIVIVHTEGPYPGLRQILALQWDNKLGFLHTGEVREFGGQTTDDVLKPFAMPPDGRMSKAMKVIAKPGYTLYREKLA